MNQRTYRASGQKGIDAIKFPTKWWGVSFMLAMFALDGDGLQTG